MPDLLGRFTSIKVKLLGGFLLISVLVFIFSAISVATSFNTLNVIGQISKKDLPRLQAIEKTKDTAVHVKNTLDAYQMYEERSAQNQVRAQEALILSDLTKIQQDVVSYKQLQSDTSHSTELQAIVKESNALVLNIKALSSFDQMLPLERNYAVQATSSATLAIKRTLMQHAESLLQNIDALVKDEYISIGTKTASIPKDLYFRIQLSVSIAVLSLVFSLGIGLFVSSTLTKSLLKLRQAASEVSKGNMNATVDIKSNDEIGQLAHSYNEMLLKLRESYLRLSEESEKGEIYIKSIGEGVIAFDHSKRIFRANSIAKEILGLAPDQGILGKLIYEAMPLFEESGPKIQPESYPGIIAFNNLQRVQGTYLLHRVDGKQMILNVTASPLIRENEATGGIIILRDITKEKDVDRMKTEFISLASHQLRTPLSAIKWFTEMLLDGDAGKMTVEQEDFAKNINASTERMISLVNSLLNISRMESGRIIVDPQPTDLKELVDGVVTDLRAKIEERKQHLIISVHNDLPKINVDPKMIRQVFLNLLTNAIKYTPKEGEISVFISRNEDEIICQVTDNGYGIPEAEQGKVFQKFFRAENVVKVETDGTGLGLYLIRSIIESSRGKIWFESKEGKGTTFWFALPLSGSPAKKGEVTLD